MKFLFSKVLLNALLLIVIISNSYGQNQLFLSKAYQVEGTIQDIFQQATVRTDIYGNVYQAGSTINSLGNYDILVKKWDEYGILLWTYQHDGSAQEDDFSLDMLIDDSLNIYIAGGITNSTSDSLDAVVIKIGPNGNFIWELSYDGAVYHNDIATSICRDGNNDFYLTGSTYIDFSTKYNSLALKFNSSGNTLWTNSFDFNMLDNSGLKVSLDSISGNLVIIGVSHSGSISNSYFVNQYTCDPTSGSLISPNYIENLLNGSVLDIKDIIRSKTGDIFLAGRSIDTSTGEIDIVSIKLSSSFHMAWMVKHNGLDSLDDGANCVFVDDSGYVYVTGYVGTVNRGKDLIALKYSNTGTLIWKETFKGAGHDEGNKIIVNNEGYVFATGYTTTNTATDILVLSINPEGRLAWYKSIDGDFHNRDFGVGVFIDENNDLIVNAKVELGSANVYTNIIIKYEIASIPVSIVDVDSSPHHLASQVLISFNTSSLISANIDNTEKEFGVVSDFVNITTIDSIASLIGGDPGLANWMLIKINPNFTTADTMGYDIDGNHVKLMPVYNDFLMIIPDGFDADSIVNLLDSNFTVEYCGLNHIGKALTGDPLYEYQTGFFYDDIEGNHVNIEGAWGIETGHQDIHVGIFDSGINFSHQDFEGVNGPVVVDGIRNNGGFIRISQDNSHAQTAHGTQVSGIVGAVRNNGKNVAGIAGGDYSLSSPGVSLFSLVMLDNGNLATENNTIRIMNESQRIFDLHINNYSWEIPSAHLKSELAKSVYNTFRLKRTQIAASGYGNGEGRFYPASYPDPWVIKVGATQKNPSDDNKPIRWPLSTYGNNMDVMAPGVQDEYASLSWLGKTGNNSIGSGTSIAAPHVSGLAALLQSHVWRNHYGGSSQLLHPEDMEYLIEQNARDMYSIYDLGTTIDYDEMTGFGIINGTASLEAIEWPNYQIFRHELSGVNCSSTKINSSLITVTLENEFYSLQPGIYQANIYKISGTRTHFASQEGTYLDSWIRHSGSWGYYYNESTSPASITLHNFNTTFAEFSNTPNTTSASLYTYMIEIVIKGGQDLPNPVYYPAPQAEITMAYSIYVHDQSATVNIQSPDRTGITVFPNPNSDEQIFINISETVPTGYTIEIFNLEGKLLLNQKVNHIPGERLSIGTGTLPKGMYLMRVSDEYHYYTTKFIKN